MPVLQSNQPEPGAARPHHQSLGSELGGHGDLFSGGGGGSHRGGQYRPLFVPVHLRPGDEFHASAGLGRSKRRGGFRRLRNRVPVGTGIAAVVGHMYRHARCRPHHAVSLRAEGRLRIPLSSYFAVQARTLKILGKIFLPLYLLLAISQALSAQYTPPVSKKGVSIDQKLNAPVPLELVFRDEANQPVALRTYFGDKPVVLALVYYSCPGLC